MDQSTPAPLSPGARLGPYEITGALGAGGMGEVFRAKDTRLGRDVAVKVLPTSFAVDPDRQRRFEQEARAVAALNHPNVLVVHDVGTHEGRSWIVTELLEGETLREKLREGRLPPRKAVDVAIQVARGLSAAHEKGIVHRDLKPENVFLTRDGRAKILDFGLARVDLLSLDREAETQTSPNEGTSPGMILGTMAYMSPEQARGRPADARSDVFALGAVLYEMLAGKRPFAGATLADTLSAILREDPPTFDTGSAVVPSALDRVVRRCLEKEPSERFQTARDVGFALEALTQATESAASGEVLGGAVTEADAGRRIAWPSLLRGVALVALGMAVASGARWLLAPPLMPRVVGYRPLTGGNLGYIGSFATDGERVYFSTGQGTRQVSLAGGASAPVPVPFRFYGQVVDFSKLRSSLLMIGWDDAASATSSGRGPLWSVPVPAGGGRKLGLDANDAAWSPDGLHLAFVDYESPPSRLSVAQADGSEHRILYESPDRLWWVRWSPDGSRLRFGLVEAETLQYWIAEIPAEGGTPRRLFPGLRGDWSPDGRAFVFSRGNASAGWGFRPAGGSEGRSDLFAAVEPPRWQAWRRAHEGPLTFGPLQMFAPTPVPGGRHLVAWGSDRRGRLMRYNAKTARFEPLLEGFAGGFVDYSWDGQWMAWVDLRDLTLWRSRSDGREPLQLTTPAVAVGLVRWSPDGKRLAFVGKPPDSLPRIYVIPSDGGRPEPISPPEKGEVWDPWWLPDGKTVLWGRILGAGIRAFDLSTGKAVVLPQSDDLRIQSCSRQGLVLVEMTDVAGGGPHWGTYDPRTGRREDLGLPPTMAYPRFTRDGGSVRACSWTSPGIYGFSLRERRLEKVADLGGMEINAPIYFYCWSTLDPSDAPIVMNDTSTYELYALDVEWP
jgi:eukaryotic-like serine/threonine-protein kinase